MSISMHKGFSKKAICLFFGLLFLPSVAFSKVSYTRYLYDNSGNTSYHQDEYTRLSLSYNSSNCLIKFSINNNKLQEKTNEGFYAYNYLGMRTKKVIKEESIDYVYDDKTVLLEEIGNSIHNKYNYGIHLLSLDDKKGLHRQYYYDDALNSVSDLTRVEGESVLSTYIYTPWGDFRNELNNEITINKFNFTGKKYDKETGMIYFGARYYQDGRFITQDTYLGEIKEPSSLHRYLYCYGNPSKYIDLYGNQNIPLQELPSYVSPQALPVLIDYGSQLVNQSQDGLYEIGGLLTTVPWQDIYKWLAVSTCAYTDWSSLGPVVYHGIQAGTGGVAILSIGGAMAGPYSGCFKENDYVNIEDPCALMDPYRYSSLDGSLPTFSELWSWIKRDWNKLWISEDDYSSLAITDPHFSPDNIDEWRGDLDNFNDEYSPFIDQYTPNVLIMKHGDIKMKKHKKREEAKRLHHISRKHSGHTWEWDKLGEDKPDLLRISKEEKGEVIKKKKKQGKEKGREKWIKDNLPKWIR